MEARSFHPAHVEEALRETVYPQESKNIILSRTLGIAAAPTPMQTVALSVPSASQELRLPGTDKYSLAPDEDEEREEEEVEKREGQGRQPTDAKQKPVPVKSPAQQGPANPQPQPQLTSVLSSGSGGSVESGGQIRQASYSSGNLSIAFENRLTKMVENLDKRIKKFSSLYSIYGTELGKDIYSCPLPIRSQVLQARLIKLAQEAAQKPTETPPQNAQSQAKPTPTDQPAATPSAQQSNPPQPANQPTGGQQAANNQSQAPQQTQATPQQLKDQAAKPETKPNLDERLKSLGQAMQQQAADLVARGYFPLPLSPELRDRGRAIEEEGKLVIRNTTADLLQFIAAEHLIRRLANAEITNGRYPVSSYFDEIVQINRDIVDIQNAIFHRIQELHTSITNQITQLQQKQAEITEDALTKIVMDQQKLSALYNALKSLSEFLAVSSEISIIRDTLTPEQLNTIRTEGNIPQGVAEELIHSAATELRLRGLILQNGEKLVDAIGFLNSLSAGQTTEPEAAILNRTKGVANRLYDVHRKFPSFTNIVDSVAAAQAAILRQFSSSDPFVSSDQQTLIDYAQKRIAALKYDPSLFEVALMQARSNFANGINDIGYRSTLLAPYIIASTSQAAQAGSAGAPALNIERILSGYGLQFSRDVVERSRGRVGLTGGFTGSQIFPQTRTLSLGQPIAGPQQTKSETQTTTEKQPDVSQSPTQEQAGSTQSPKSESTSSSGTSNTQGTQSPKSESTSSSATSSVQGTQSNTRPNSSGNVRPYREDTSSGTPASTGRPVSPTGPVFNRQQPNRRIM